MVNVIFYLAALCSIAGAIGVVVSPNPIHSAMFLVMTLMSFAVHYILLGADLAAAVQVIVYASAIVILFLFVIMLLGVDKRETNAEPLIGQRIIASFVSILFALTLLFIGGLKWASGEKSVTGSLESSKNNGLGNVEIVSQKLFTNYVFVFELTGVLLIGAVIGAVVLARRSGTKDEDLLDSQDPDFVKDFEELLAATIFCIGLAGVSIRKNAIVMFMSIELMLNAANLTFVAYSKLLDDVAGQVAVFFTLVVAAGEVAVGLALMVAIFKRTKSGTSPDDISLMRETEPAQIKVGE